MKKRMLNYLTRMALVAVLVYFLTSCGAFYFEGYDDGVYGERTSRYVYERTSSPSQTHDSYRAYLQQKADHFKDFEHGSAMASHYESQPSQSAETYTHSGVAPKSSVTIYNNYNNGYNPYWDWNYGHSYYWGRGAWYPYDVYPYYHRPYRSGWSISIGTYDPYFWNPYYRYGGYYYRYYPEYYPYYGYYDRGYYVRTGDVRVQSRRGDSNRYDSYQNTQRSYYDRRGSYGGGNPSVNRNYQSHSLPTSGYENRNYSQPVSRHTTNSRGYSSENNSSNTSAGYRSSNRR